MIDKKDGLFTNKESFMYKINDNVLLIFITLILIGGTYLTSYQPIWANIPINIVLPILVMVFLKTVFFEKLKLSTLLLMRALIVFAVLNILPGNWYVTIVLVFLSINILEATFTDLKKKKYFNFVVGLALAVSVLTLRGTWKGFIYEANTISLAGTICWIIAYTIWNWIFVTNEFSSSIAKLHVGILFTPLILIAFTLNAGYWLVFRANSLTLGGVIQISNKKYLEETLYCPYFTKFVEWSKKSSVQIVAMIINIALITVPVVFYFIGD